MEVEKEYDPFFHRPESQKTTSTFATFMHLLKMAIGTGILMLPFAFKEVGYGTALLSSALMTIIAIHAAITMIQCSHRLCKRAKVPSLTFSETMATAFRFGPPALRGWSVWTGKFVNAFVCLVHYQTTVVYALYIAELLHQLTKNSLNWDVRWLLLCLLPFFLLSSLIPNFRTLAIFSVLGFVCLSAAVLCSIFYFTREPTPMSELEPFPSIWQAPSYCAIFLFSLYNTSAIMPLENTMKYPKKMPTIPRGNKLCESYD